MNPEIFSIGDLSIRWYSVLILVGVIVAFILADRQARKKGYPKDFIFDMGFWVVVFGIIGARLYYVLFNLNDYKTLLDVISVWNGGLAIHGGLIAGFVTMVVYCKIKNFKLFDVTDIAVPSVIIAQAIGRWGNFFNSEAHGPDTSAYVLQQKGFIPDFVINGMKIDGVYYHPTFYYESVWCVLGFLILLICRKLFKLRVGQLTCLYLIWYSIGRYLIESLRTDSLYLGSIKVAQLVSICLFTLGFIGMFIFGFINDKKES